MTIPASLKVKIFADGAQLTEMRALAQRPYIRGFTTNPTLMRHAGITDYHCFAQQVLAIVPDHPISFEVVADEVDGMEREARAIAAWGSNVFVKIPITTTRGELTTTLIHRLSLDGIQVNATALLTLDQVGAVAGALRGGAPAHVSVFAGRIADTGRDPVPIVREAVARLAAAPNAELIWASPRELLNLFQADEAGCHIITLVGDILKKLDMVGKDLASCSLDVVRMFHDDAVRAGLTVPLGARV